LNQQKQTRKIESHNRARNRTENSLSQHRQASKKNFTTKGAMETAEYMLQEVMGLKRPSWLSREEYCWAMP